MLFRQINAPAHKSVVAMAKINEIRFELLPHASYSPDLIPRIIFWSQTWQNGSTVKNFPTIKKWCRQKMAILRRQLLSTSSTFLSTHQLWVKIVSDMKFAKSCNFKSHHHKCVIFVPCVVFHGKCRTWFRLNSWYAPKQIWCESILTLNQKLVYFLKNIIWTDQETFFSIFRLLPE